MRELTQAEHASLSNRRARFDSFLEERMPVLTDFIERLGLPDASMVLVNADSFVPVVSEFMENQEITVEDRAWIMARIGYLVGVWLVQKYGGCWFLNELPETRYFLSYVVGQFTGLPNSKAMVDPFFVARIFVDTPSPRSLAQVLVDLESKLRAS